ncbi:MAG: CrcB family protein, partial [Halanaeroarchaeum sp.]
MPARSTDTLRTIESLVLIAIGGFAGANLRYLLADVVGGATGTLFVNVLGSFALGFLLYEARYSGIISNRSRIVVGT